MTVVALDDPDTWPDEVVAIVSRYQRPPQERGDRLLAEALQAHALRLYHCTRLTDLEHDDVRANGLHAGSPQLIAAKIDSAVAAGHLDPQLGGEIRRRHWGRQDARDGYLGLLSGAERLTRPQGLRYFLDWWGGESITMPFAAAANYGHLELGTATVVQAAVPFGHIEHIRYGLAAAAWRALHRRDDPGVWQASTRRGQGIAADHIEAVHQPGSPFFNTWLPWWKE